MILFCTRSLKYSTDVPWPRGGLPAPPSEVVPEWVSECNDCTSHSLLMSKGVPVMVGVVVPVAAAAKERLVRLGIVPVDTGLGTGVVEPEALDLKELRRFCADDFLRMAGRGWLSVIEAIAGRKTVEFDMDLNA